MCWFSLMVQLQSYSCSILDYQKYSSEIIAFLFVNESGLAHFSQYITPVVPCHAEEVSRGQDATDTQDVLPNATSWLLL